MSATQFFLDEVRRSTSAIAWLIRVYLGDPSTRTLHLSMSGFDTPDGQTWEAAIASIGDVTLPGAPLSTGVSDSGSMSFKLASRAGLCFQNAGDNITNLFHDFRWYGARVELLMWPLRSSDIADMYRKFVGQVQTYKIGAETCEVVLTQRDDWNKQLSPIIATRATFPRLPDHAVNQPLPTIYGRVGLEMRGQLASLPNVREFERVSGLKLGIPAVCIDTGRGGGDPQKIAIAGHRVQSHSDGGNGTTYAVEQDGIACPIEPSALFNTDTLAGFDTSDEFDGMFIPISPTDAAIDPTGTAGALNTRYALDQFDEASYCEILNSPAHAAQATWGCEYLLPTLPSPGTMIEVWIVCGYKITVAGTADCRAYLRRGATTLSDISLSGSLTLNAPSTLRLSAGTVWGHASNGLPATPWDFAPTRLGFFIGNGGLFGAPSAPVSFKLYWIGLEAQVAPKARTWTPRSTIKPRLKLRKTRERGLPVIFEPGVVVPSDTEIESAFYGTVEGLQDDSLGSHTGTPSALIERGCDIARHLLVNYGGQIPEAVTTGTGVHGSFDDARNDLTWRKTMMRQGLQITERSDIGTQIDAVAASSLSQCLQDEETDKFLWLPWREGAGVEYPRQVYLADLRRFPEIEPIDTKRVPSGVTVRYGWDGIERKLALSTHCATDGSSAGHLYRGLRDERFLIEADINDRFVIQNAGGGSLHGAGFGQVLPAGDYTDEQFLAVLHSFMFNYVDLYAGVAYGGLIIAGVNDNFQIKYGIGTFISCTIPAGRYTMEEQAAALETALEAADGGASWTVAYSRGTRKFSITRAGGNFSIWMATVLDSAAAAYGFSPRDGAVSGSTITSEFALDEQLIAFSFPQQFAFRFATNSFGSETSVPKTCAVMVGFDPRFDREDAYFHVADTYKGHSEKLLQAGADSYGYTRDAVVECRAIYDTDTAREIRNRVHSYVREPRVRFSFESWRFPDLKRGMVLRFDDFDNSGIAYPKRGSDGLWTGKTFRVLSIRASAGISTDQEIEVIDNDPISKTDAPTPTLGDYGVVIPITSSIAIWDDFAVPV